MKNFIFNLKSFFEDVFKNISRIFLKYFPKNSQKASRCGSCYSICTPLGYWLELSSYHHVSKDCPI